MTEEVWRSPASREERAAEQDRAAGGREKRIVYTGGPKGRSVASVALRPFKDGGLSASIRYKSEKKTHTTYIGRINASTREDALKKAWSLVREKHLLR